MTDSWSTIVQVAASAGALVTIAGAWLFFGLPVPAMRGWVHETIRPFHEDGLTLLHERRELRLAQIFQWESNGAMDSSAGEQALRRWHISRLKDELAEIDRQIAARSAR